MISFVIPAYNEERYLPATLERLFPCASALGEPFEVIVADDASTDRTAEIARSAGARVVSTRNRQIAATRNAGAREAKGDILAFVDADTLVSEAVLRATLEAVRGGAVGGGARVTLDRVSPIARASLATFVWFYHRCGYAGGCYMFARRDAFEAIGGFDERYFATEEMWLSRALRDRGRFVIVKEPVVSSGRKLRLYSRWEILAPTLRFFFRGGFAAFRRREGLGIWYEGRREA
jgi:glycosyltransferase involved in cell wall biosynthesis